MVSMLVVARSKYTVPLEDVEKHTADHRAYMRKLFDAGKLVASGPLVPRTGGLLMFRVESREEAELLLADDPFFERDIAVYEVNEWAPTLGKDKLDAL
ncbi:MAG: YciI family protein [Polyangiales bacterium]